MSEVDNLSATVGRITQAIVSLDRYDIESEPFAEGSYGTVYRAIERDPPNRRVAIKRLYPLLRKEGSHQFSEADPDEISRAILSFFRETFVQLSAAHPAVVPLLGWNVLCTPVGVEFVIVTELMGPTLELPRSGPRDRPLSATDKTIIHYGIARGMAHLHSLSILHRDLKPANIFLDLEGRPRIADLGLAKVSVTPEQSVQAGTPVYLAPEVWKSNVYTFPADVYSYAMIMYELLEDTMAVAPGVSNLQQLQLGVTSGVRPPLSATPRRLRTVLARLWPNDPDARPSFAVIASKLRKPRYWVPGTDEAAFERYRAWLDAEELRTRPGSFNPDWLAAFDGGVLASLQAVRDVFSVSAVGNYGAQVAEALLSLTGAWGIPGLCHAAGFVRDLPNAPHLKLLGSWYAGGSPLTRGALAEHEGRVADALALYKEAATSGDLEGVLRYGKLLLTNGRPTEGIAVLGIAAELGDPRANYTLGEWHFREGAFAKARAHFEAAAGSEAVEGHVEPLLMAGVAAARAGDAAAAHSLLIRARDAADLLNSLDLAEAVAAQLSKLGRRPRK
jgi:tetratricopeptide (TPR) repeat protein